MAGFYDRIAGLYDVFTWGADKRYARLKRRAFSGADGRTLLVGVGTGRDLDLLPEGLDLVGIDLSTSMLARARRRAIGYKGSVVILERNIEDTGFPEHHFDTVLTSCVFCSVGDPVKGLKEIRRILKPGGRLIMFEHMLSRNPLLQPMLYSMNFMIPIGPRFTRKTLANVRAAGFNVVLDENVYMDIVKHIEAVGVDQAPGIP